MVENINIKKLPMDSQRLADIITSRSKPETVKSFLDLFIEANGHNALRLLVDYSSNFKVDRSEVYKPISGMSDLGTPISGSTKVPFNNSKLRQITNMAFQKEAGLGTYNVVFEDVEGAINDIRQYLADNKSSDIDGHRENFDRLSEQVLTSIIDHRVRVSKNIKPINISSFSDRQKNQQHADLTAFENIGGVEKIDSLEHFMSSLSIEVEQETPYKSGLRGLKQALINKTSGVLVESEYYNRDLLNLLKRDLNAIKIEARIEGLGLISGFYTDQEPIDGVSDIVEDVSEFIAELNSLEGIVDAAIQKGLEKSQAEQPSK